MFNVSEEVKAKVEAALSVLREYKRGDRVPHEELEKATGLNRDCGTDYYRIVMKARKRLRDEDGIWSCYEQSEGFHLYTERETLTEEPKFRSKKARRQMRYVVKAATAIPTNSLSFTQRRLQEAVVDSAKEMARKLSAKAEVAEQASQPYKGMPIRKVESLTPPVVQTSAAV
jgi:hypothetical protein